LKKARESKDFESIVIAFKRAMNILKGAPARNPINASLLSHAVEKNLYQAFSKAQERIDGCLDKRDYESALQEMIQMKKPIDDFFDGVMVMVEDEKIRNNVTALLDGYRAGCPAELSRLCLVCWFEGRGDNGHEDLVTLRKVRGAEDLEGLTDVVVADGVNPEPGLLYHEGELGVGGGVRARVVADRALVHQQCPQAGPIDCGAATLPLDCSDPTRMSSTRVLLPEPETPVTTVSRPSGSLSSRAANRWPAK
jgi:hypothetical protein